MTRNRNNVVLFLLLTVVVLMVLPGADAGPGNSGFIRRFAANFDTFGNPPELITSAAPLPGAQGGLVIYDKDFFTANDINVLYVTVSAVGDTHDGARMGLACQLDDTACNPGPNPVGGAVPGWVTVMRHKNYNNGDFELGATPFFGDGGGGAGDVHDNVVAYTWCTPISGAGTHNVKVRLGSTPDIEDDLAIDNNAFLEAVHFFIDGSRIADPESACTHV